MTIDRFGQPIGEPDASPSKSPLDLANERCEVAAERLEMYRSHVAYIERTGASAWVERSELDRLARVYEDAVKARDLLASSKAVTP